MAASIVYIHHDCFILRAGGRTLLFDYPAPAYLPSEAAQAAAAHIAGADLTVFVSHGHDDHFDPDLVRATAMAGSRRFVVSDDVADLHGDRLPPDTVVMEPEDVREQDGLSVAALESNDMGVAYRVEVAGLSVYFGGDLALWDWPGQTPAARRAVGMSWRRALKALSARPLDVAFSNMDPRLPSLSGAPQFVEKLGPTVFTPMHLGGHVEYIRRFADRLRRPGTTVFAYTRPGDALEIP
ncbi:MBL fold metallo-hydrolase [Solidesulfovibrio sp.]|uniref:MBL fold metallo-hydrolase n=1 Tax=Solidesulfovibrio sp. TaxID=2910990 RepID=UPI00262E7D01|nr:MBL fold metallo-hydrolase [Solidesulfovibrio sp.]